jgi:hypothetical protein
MIFHHKHLTVEFEKIEIKEHVIWMPDYSFKSFDETAKNIVFNIKDLNIIFF